MNRIGETNPFDWLKVVKPPFFIYLPFNVFARPSLWSPDSNGRQIAPKLWIQEINGFTLNHCVHLEEETEVVGMNPAQEESFTLDGFTMVNNDGE